MKLIAIGSCVLVTVVTAFGADQDVEALLAKMRAAYSGAKSARLHVTAKAQGTAANATTVVEYMAPNKVRAVITSGGRSATLYCDGKNVTVLPKGGEPVTMSYRREIMESALPVNLEVICFYDWQKQLSTAKGNNMEKSKLKIVPGQSWNGKKWTVLEETASAQKVFVRYYIDPSTSLIWRTVVQDLDKKNTLLESTLTSVSLNVSLKESIFVAPKKA